MRGPAVQWAVTVSAQVLLLLAAALLALSVGATSLSAPELLELVAGRGDPVARTVFLEIRAPRILLAFAVGGALSLAGALLQGLFRNPLVEPYTLGISGGAALSISAGIAFGLGRWAGGAALPVVGLAGAAITAVVVYTLGTRSGAVSVRDLVLVGVMVSFVCSSLVMLLMALAQAADLQGIVFWTMGSLDEPNRALIGVALAVSVGSLVVSYALCRNLNALSVGEEVSRHLGVDVEWTKRVVFFLAALLTGVSVAVAGVIGFVGLVVPHVVRLLVGRDHRVLLVSSFLSGATFLILCDCLARSLLETIELPVGVITGIVGGTTFVWLLSRRRGSLGVL